jgi:S-formylglutathione hydrolase FrmB
MTGSRRCSSRRWAGLALVAAALAPAASGTPANAAPANAAIVSEQRIDPRLRELTIAAPALAGETRVRVLLPDGYRARDERRNPVLYLLHGAGGDETDWTDDGAAERATAGVPLIVVMPDGGEAGWYTDWYNDGAGGPPAWERYHVRELIPLIDRRYRTVPARRGRAIAGLSMGGFGAFSYAARHPDAFTAAASFSGGVDLNAELLGVPIGLVAVSGSLTLAGLHDVNGATVFGDFFAENVLWRAHNPVDLAANLGGLKLALYTGNGDPGGPYGPARNQDLIETGAHRMNVNLDRRLNRLGLPHRWVDYGPGGHTWPYWRRDLRRTVPWLMSRFDHPRPAPRRVEFTAVEPSYEAYGWRVRLRRPNAEFSTLSEARRRGFELTGSGRGVVRTPSRYRPGALYLARIRRAGNGSNGDVERRAVRVRRITATGSGRLRVPVRLAATNRFDEGSPGATAGPVHSGTVRVDFRRVPGGR